LLKTSCYHIVKKRKFLYYQIIKLTPSRKFRIALNETINTVMILKEKLKHIWTYRSRTWATKAIDQWCALARSLNHPSVNSFANMLERYQAGILNYCDYPIHTGKLEGVNNKIKVIKRKAYGFQDLRYFTLKIYQAFAN
jgi:transposase